MGTESTLTGSIKIVPAPRVSDYDIVKLKAERNIGWGLECIGVTFAKESTFETEDDGTEVTRLRVTEAHIEACGQSGHKHYYTLPTLQAIVNMLGHDRQYNGYFEYVDEYGAMKRYAIVQGIAREYEPTITWPEEAC